MCVKLQETTRQPRGGLSRGLSCPHFSGKSLCEGRGRGQGTGRDTAPGTSDYGKRGHPQQTKEPGSWGGRGPACPEQRWEQVGPCTRVLKCIVCTGPTQTQAGAFQGLMFQTSRQAPCTTLLSFWGSQVYSEWAETGPRW